MSGEVSPIETQSEYAGDTLINSLASRELDSFTAAEVHAMFATAVRALSHMHELGQPCDALAEGQVIAPTDVVRGASALLAASGLEPFELALWNSFGALPPK